MKVYLMGGMKSGWQDRVIQSLPQHSFLDPRSHGLVNAIQYTDWDLKAAREADCGLAYLEGSNPYGYNLAFEMGYMAALGKRLLLVDEKHADNPRALSMLRVAADVFDTLDDAITALEKYPPASPPISNEDTPNG